MNAANSRSIFPFSGTRINMILVLGVILVIALISFEIFNYSTTEYALKDLLGDLNFLGLSWATILTIAFCGIDFAGISRLFITGRDENEPSEAWYLFGAWMLSATMNAALTWWGVSMAVLSHPIQSVSLLDSSTIIRVVPVFVALMVWLIRILAIGTVATAGKNIFRAARRPGVSAVRRSAAYAEEIPSPTPVSRPVVRPLAPRMTASSPRTQQIQRGSVESGHEPTYHNFS
ncbi:MAG: hypothetical protein LWX83_09510 [Anaerolineae bacterium]|nr:hypothetical protein [Anaerolineae bacterium]